MSISQAQQKQEKRVRRHRRIRSHMRGTAETPRLAIYRSNKYIYAQIIDDVSGTTLAQADGSKEKKGTKVERAALVGAAIAEAAKKLSISKVVFDRGGFRYTGRVAALAEAARKGGLEF